jgi:hypothetical protein
MAVTEESAGPAIRPFEIPVTPEGELGELRARIAIKSGASYSCEGRASRGDVPARDSSIRKWFGSHEKCLHPSVW